MLFLFALLLYLILVMFKVSSYPNFLVELLSLVQCLEDSRRRNKVYQLIKSQV